MPGSVAGQSRRLAELAVLVSLALSQGGCITIPHGLIGGNKEDTAARIRRAIPDGSPAEQAAALMRRSGYRCRRLRDLALDGDRKTPEVLSCGATPGVSSKGGFFFTDEYYVYFEVKDGGAYLRYVSVSAQAL